MAPAVTPVKSVLEKQTNNPGVRLFQYDPHDYKLLVSWYHFRTDPIFMHIFVVFISFVECFQHSYCELYFYVEISGCFSSFLYLECQHFLSVGL